MPYKAPPTISDSQRPLCPICGDHLKFYQLEDGYSTNYYWYCPCLINLERLVDDGKIIADQIFYE